jgi:large subunit ribosomal protein L20
MVRIRRGKIAVQRHKKVLNLTNGFRGAHSKLFRIANQQLIKGLRYSYKGRKQRKRSFRSLWVAQINAAIRPYDLSYSQLISVLKRENISVNRKMLAKLAISDLVTFDQLVLFIISQIIISQIKN